LDGFAWSVGRVSAEDRKAEDAESETFGMIADDAAAGDATGIAFLVVEPDAEAVLPESLDALGEEAPVVLIGEVIVAPGEVDDGAAEATLDEEVGEVRGGDAAALPEGEVVEDLERPKG